MIDLEQLEKAGRDRHRRKLGEFHLWFRDPDAAEQLRDLAQVFKAARQKGPRKVRGHRRPGYGYGVNIQTHKSEALHWAICEIDEIRQVNGGKGLGVHERKDGNKRYYSGPLVRLITLLCQQLAIAPPSAHTVFRAIQARKKAEKVGTARDTAAATCGQV